MGELQVIEAVEQPMNLAQVKARVNLVQEVMRHVMKSGTHYGTIPGCGEKPALFKAGAETLAMTFRLCPEYDVQIKDLDGGHREVQVCCRILAANGSFLGQGVGSCSSMESKFRYRKSAAAFTVLEEEIPKDYKEKKADYRKRGFGCQKVEGEWKWVHFEAGESEHIENPDPADTFNTVLKMAKKRAFVDATLTVTGASDIFTQDIEEALIDPETGEIKPAAGKAPPPAPQRKAPAPPASAPPAAPQPAQTPPPAATEAPATPPADSGKASKGKVISEAQRKRMWAISHKQGWTDAQAKELLGMYGYTTSADVLMGQDYEDICTAFGKPPEGVATTPLTSGEKF